MMSLAEIVQEDGWIIVGGWGVDRGDYRVGTPVRLEMDEDSLVIKPEIGENFCSAPGLIGFIQVCGVIECLTYQKGGRRVYIDLKNPVLAEKFEEQRHFEKFEQEAPRLRFIANLLGKFGGKKLIDLNISKDNVTLVFEGGESMKFDVTVGGDEYEGWLEVEGISIDTFDKPTSY